MATTFKTFLNNDIAATRTMLHEAIPITGSLVSGTYGGNTVALGSGLMSRATRTACFSLYMTILT